MMSRDTYREMGTRLLYRIRNVKNDVTICESDTDCRQDVGGEKRGSGWTGQAATGHMGTERSGGGEAAVPTGVHSRQPRPPRAHTHKAYSWRVQGHQRAQMRCGKRGAAGTRLNHGMALGNGDGEERGRGQGGGARGPPTANTLPRNHILLPSHSLLQLPNSAAEMTHSTNWVRKMRLMQRFTMR